jgi:hypothetical protein
MIFLISSASSCEKHKIGHFKEDVINFSDVNTIWDDYNSTSPEVYNNYLFHFSSNRNSYGNDFDIVGEDMTIIFNINTGGIGIESSSYGNVLSNLMPMFEAINTANNELGPYSLFYQKDPSSSDGTMQDLVMYATDSSGDYDIKFSYTDISIIDGSSLTDTPSTYDLGFINTEANELYPSFFGKDFYYHALGTPSTNKIEKIIYCSDKDGDYDIYDVNFLPEASLIETLQTDLSVEPEKLDINSGSDDKCPNVNGKLLVFSSNRPGGYGGFDLYYSFYENGSWTDPLNFGADINTEFDEYRPITIQDFSFDNMLMIFSSDRPGGKGGFDLYYTGVNQKIE